MFAAACRCTRRNLMLKMTVFQLYAPFPLLLVIFYCSHFFLFFFLPCRNGSRIGSAARLPQIMQCSQAKHRCVCMCVCVCVCVCVGPAGCLWGGSVTAQRSKLIPKKSPTASPDKPSQHAAKQTLQRFFLPWLLDLNWKEKKSFAASCLKMVKSLFAVIS